MQNLVIYCADIGSVAAGKFGWARRSTSSPADFDTSTSIKELAQGVATDLNANLPVTLGLECPLFIPLPQNPVELTRARAGEGKRPWSAGAGTAALAIGITESTWLLAEIRTQLQADAEVYLDWDEFCSTDGGLFLWEAFVSSTAKGVSHTDDAVIGIDAFISSLPDITAANAIQEDSVISLIGAALVRTGWTTDPQILSRECVVIRA